MKAQALAVDAVPIQAIDVVTDVTTEGQPPFGGTSSQFALVVTPVMLASAKA